MESNEKMKKGLITTVTLILIIALTGFAGCSGDKEEANDKHIVEIQKGDLYIGVTADGNLVMPHEVKLRFGTPGTVKEVMVNEGDVVKAGTLLAKLDDTSQKIAIESAQYDVQLALNNLMETVPGCCQVLGYPRRYPNTSAVYRFEQALQETEESQELIEQNNYEEAASHLHLAQYDLEASLKMMEDPITDVETYPDIASAFIYDDDPEGIFYEQSYPNIPKAIELIKQDQERLSNSRNLIEQGNYKEAISVIKIAKHEMETTLWAVKKASGQIERYGVSYPDTATSLDFLMAAEGSLKKMQKLMEQDNYDPVEFARTLLMAQHDLEMSHEILENNELVFEHGLSLKDAQQYNLNLQKAEVSLRNYKEELMKTEILATFDGTVVDIGVKENDQLSSFDYSSTTAIHLVDTGKIELDGIVDEIDIFKVKVGQKAIITVDALSYEELTGTVTFISPSGTQKTGVVNYAVTIEIEPTNIELKGGLTATADIIVKRTENVLLIPNGAIIEAPEGYLTEVVINEETMETEKRPITLGTRNERYSEVKSGLTEGEKVIVETSRPRSFMF